jgi:hypothetical protein
MVDHRAYVLDDDQTNAIADYFFVREKVKTLRELAPILKSSVQRASDIAYRVLGQWAREGKIIPKL